MSSFVQGTPTVTGPSNWLSPAQDLAQKDWLYQKTRQAGRSAPGQLRTLVSVLPLDQNVVLTLSPVYHSLGSEAAGLTRQDITDEKLYLLGGQGTGVQNRAFLVISSSPGTEQ